MEPTREEIRLWLNGVLKKTGLSASALARKAGVATTTLTRFLNDENYRGLPELSTLAKIAAVGGVPAIGLDAPAHRKQIGMAEGMAFKAKTKRVQAIISALTGDREAAFPWMLTTDALEGVGYLNGDIVIVDDYQKPDVGDVVCVQHEQSAAEVSIIFRVYEPPYLVAAPIDAELRTRLRKPLLVDGSSVRIVGVVTDLVRLADQ